MSIFATSLSRTYICDVTEINQAFNDCAYKERGLVTSKTYRLLKASCVCTRVFEHLSLSYVNDFWVLTNVMILSIYSCKSAYDCSMTCTFDKRIIKCLFRGLTINWSKSNILSSLYEFYFPF